MITIVKFAASTIYISCNVSENENISVITYLLLSKRNKTATFRWTVSSIDLMSLKIGSSPRDPILSYKTSPLKNCHHIQDGLFLFRININPTAIYVRRRRNPTFINCETPLKHCLSARALLTRPLYSPYKVLRRRDI